MKLIFSHGKESGPYGHKIIALIRIALAKGLHVQSLDYRAIPCPEQRAETLIHTLSKADEPHLLVGSSMGGYVSLVASQAVPVAGLFLLAPAIGMEGYARQDFILEGGKTEIVQGWGDTVVPVPHVIRFAHEQRAALHLLDSDHRLTSAMPEIRALFSRWLDRQSPG